MREPEFYAMQGEALVIEAILRGKDRRPAQLPAGSIVTVTLRARPPVGTAPAAPLLSNAVMAIVSTDGEVAYTGAIVAYPAGYYDVEFKAVQPDGTPQKFPTKGYALLYVEAQIA